MSRTRAAWMLAALAGAGLIVSALIAPESLPKFVLCPMRRFFDLSCPGCGLTHSVCAISHARFDQAWDFNPFGFVIYACALAIVLRPLLLVLAPATDGRLMRSKLPAIVIIIVSVGLLLFGAMRILHQIMVRSA